MRCVVPNCRNLLQEWIAPFPTDTMLLCRWKECIEVGSGSRLPDMQTLAQNGFVCNMHFLGFSPEDVSHYIQPTLFFRDSTVLEVECCCLCSRMHIKENMLEKDATLKGNHTLEHVINNFYGSSILNENESAEYLCEECVVKVDLVRTLQRQVESAKRELKRLRQKMAKEKIYFTENREPVVTNVELESILQIESVEVDEDLFDDIQSSDPVEPPEESSAKKQKRSEGATTRAKIEKSRLKCYICSTEFESSDSILNHLMLTHTDQDALHCQLCDVRFERSPEYNAHLAKHDPEVRPLKCNHCPLRFAKLTGRSLHEAAHHNVGKSKLNKKPRPKNYMCTTCGSKYRSQSDLDRHEKVQHKGETFVTCKTCQKPFASMRNLKRHLLIHRGERPYVCKHCGVAYRQSQNLLDHVNENHGEGSSEIKYACTECSERFASYRMLTIHRRKHKPVLASRTGGETNTTTVCHLCDELFPRSIEIVAHFENHHPDQQLEHFLCNTCGEIFFHKSSFLMHVSIHSDKFVCDQCGKKHNKLHSLEVHRHLVHGIKIADQYFKDCPHCGKRLTKGNQLLRHIKTHFQGQWACEVCDQSFTERFKLRIHMRKHTGEKPLACEGCDARFGDPACLSKHRKRCEQVQSQLNQ